MIKTIVRPDGTTEILEGSADEIAELERKLKGQPQNESPKKGPKLLTE